MSSHIALTGAVPVERGLGPSRSQASLLGRYQAVRKTTEDLARPLSPEDCQIQSMPDASPVKWHLAHTTWFFETFVLAPHARGFSVFHPSFTYLFNSYYNAVGDRLARPRRGLDHPADPRGGLRVSAATDRAMEAYLESAAEHCPGAVAA